MILQPTIVETEKTIQELLDLTDARQKNFNLGRSEALKVRKVIVDYFWNEK